MSVLFGRPEKRVASLQFINPPIPPNSQADPYAYTNGGPSSIPGRTEWSLQKAAVWSCVNLIATIAEIMPLDGFQGQGQEKRQVSLPGWFEDLGGDGYGTPDWLYQAVFSQMLRGNLFGEIGDRDNRMGTPTLIVLAHPDQVQPPRGGSVEWSIAGRPVPAGQMWHKRAHPSPGRLLGMSPIEMHALTIGVGISALRFGSQWFNDGAHPTGILRNTETDLRKEGKDQSRAIKDRFLAAMRGNREPLVLGKGWEWESIQVKPNESQFLETNNFTSAECCRIFGPGFAEVFGYETGNSLTYSNIEQRSLDLLTYAADPWLVRLERMLSALLPRPRYVKFNRGSLLRTDLLTRYRAHATGIGARFLLPDEAREIEDRPPLTTKQKTDLQAIAVAPIPSPTPTQEPAPKEG